jgi:fatty acid kinase fatty acid binding subunit
VPVVVVTDSSASVDRSLAEELGLRVVPLHVLVGDAQLDEGVDEMPAELTAKSITTSAASPGELHAAYAAALAESGGDGVVAVHISRSLSATWNAATTAAEEFDGGVRVVDSCSAGLGTGFAALAAARAVRAGGDIEDAYQAAVSVAARSRCFIAVDKLDALRRGGRISTTTALLGTALVTKPLLHMVDGKLALKEKVRTSSKALRKLVDAAVAAADGSAAAIAVQHFGAADRAAEVVAELRERVPQMAELIEADLVPTLAIHVGSGAVGVVVVPGGLTTHAGSPPA